MKRWEILQKEREKIMNQLSTKEVDRAKLLVTLMDIDYEIADIQKETRQSTSISLKNPRFKKVNF